MIFDGGCPWQILTPANITICDVPLFVDTNLGYQFGWGLDLPPLYVDHNKKVENVAAKTKKTNKQENRDSRRTSK